MATPVFRPLFFTFFHLFFHFFHFWTPRKPPLWTPRKPPPESPPRSTKNRSPDPPEPPKSKKRSKNTSAKTTYDEKVVFSMATPEKVVKTPPLKRLRTKKWVSERSGGSKSGFWRSKRGQKTHPLKRLTMQKRASLFRG